MIKTTAVSCLLLANQVFAGGSPFDITQNTDTTTVTQFNSASCLADNDSYYRRFNLDEDHTLGATLSISEVEFAVEAAPATPLTLTINLYEIAHDDEFLLANLNNIGSTTVGVSELDNLTVVSTLVSGVIDGGMNDLVVEVFAADATNGESFFIGSNAAGESAPSYIVSAGCSSTEPTDTAGLGYPDMHIIMVVNGQITGPSDLIFVDGFDATSS